MQAVPYAGWLWLHELAVIRFGRSARPECIGGLQYALSLHLATESTGHVTTGHVTTGHVIIQASVDDDGLFVSLNINFTPT